MKNMNRVFTLIMIAMCSALLFGRNVAAQGEEVIHDGIYVDTVDISGMTPDEAKAAVESHLAALENTTITLQAVEGHEVEVTAGDLGIAWGNPEILEEATNYANKGNVIARYKAREDLKQDNVVLEMMFTFSESKIRSVIAEQCTAFDVMPQNPTISRVNDEFVIEDGIAGAVVDVEDSVDLVMEDLAENWACEPITVALSAVIAEPEISTDDLKAIKDVLGTFTTSYSAVAARSANVENGCNLINGTIVMPGEEFSTYDTVKPFTAANGYYMAGSYLNGMVVDSMGGGICQVSTTLYNAVLLSELEVTERNPHSMVVSYVNVSADAAISEGAGKDFKFKNNSDYPIYIEGVAGSRKITFTIYGVDNRAENRTVEYQSEILQVINPENENIIPATNQGVGYVNVQSAHIGYKARLWKIVKENGVEVSREQVNSSSYKMSPRTAVVGVNTSDPNVYNEIMAAIGTGSIDHVKGVAAALYAQITAPPVPEY